MNVFRRCLVTALFILICFILFHSSYSTRPVLRQPREVQPEIPDNRPTPRRNFAAPVNQGQQGPDKQEPISTEELVQRPLRERLQYQFPYDLESKFPAYIWQTWKYTPASAMFDEDFRIMEATWTEAHPGFVHEVISDRATASVLEYLYAAFPEVIEVYKSLPKPVLKADFFRYLILLARGGIYTDIDTYVLQSATEWLPEDFDRSTIGLIVGIEADADRPDWEKWYSRRIQFCQWTMQAKPGHPVLQDVVATITEDALRMKEAGNLTESTMDKSIVEFTGPAVWTDAIFRHINSPTNDNAVGEHTEKNIAPANFTGITAQKQVGDVVVLPITSFSPGVQQMGAEEPEHSMAFVKHEFLGAWKPPEERMDL